MLHTEPDTETAQLAELADGHAGVSAASSKPEPLPADFRSETPAAGAVFARALIDSCERRGAPLSRIGISPVLGKRLLRELEKADYGCVAVMADDPPRTASRCFACRTVLNVIEAH